MGFFDDTDFGKQKASRSPQCGKCGLLNRCRNAKLGVKGFGKKQILVVVNGPTSHDDKMGDWEETDALARRLNEYGVSLDNDCWLTGAVICTPNARGYPSADQVRHCRPNLTGVIEELDPVVIITVGSAATQGVISWDYGEGKDTRVSVWSGEAIPSQKLNAWVIPMQDPREVDSEQDVMLMDIKRTLRWAVSGTLSRPWPKKSPNYGDMVNVCMTEAEGEDAILSMLSDPRTEMLAIDYETNSLKPETKDAAIHSISWSNGYDTMASPWFPKVREASRKAMRTTIPKIACNLSFEERWTIQEFGHGIRNWKWDTMQAAHWMNQRPGITGIKFQAYAKLGQPDYSSGITPYFKSKPNTLNKIRSLDMGKLVRYNGEDTILELLVAIEQIKEAGYAWKVENDFPELRPQTIRY